MPDPYNMNPYVAQQPTPMPTPGPMPVYNPAPQQDPGFIEKILMYAFGQDNKKLKKLMPWLFGEEEEEKEEPRPIPPWSVHTNRDRSREVQKDLETP